MRPRITDIASNLVSFAIRSDKIGSSVVPIIDGGISVTVNSIGVVSLFTFTQGVEKCLGDRLKRWMCCRDVWIKDQDGSLYISQVWPWYTVGHFKLKYGLSLTRHAFSGLHGLVQRKYSVWTEGLKNWSDMGVEFSGIWLDMNEPSPFCGYSW